MKFIKVIILTLIVLFGLYLLYKEIYWRKFNCSTIKVEVSQNLDINKVQVIATHRMGDNTIFKDGSQISLTVSVFDEQPPFWDIIYSDSLYSRFLSGDFEDYREDFDYKFKFYSNLDTIFCEYRRDNNKAKIIRLEVRHARIGTLIDFPDSVIVK